MSVRALALDLEGTLHFDQRPLPGAAEALGRLRAWPGAVAFTSNNDSQAPATLSGRLRAMGLDVGGDEITTPVSLLRAYVERERLRCHLLASDEVRDAVAGSVAAPGEAVEAVVVGDRRDVTYADLDEAFRHLAAGARLVALQRGRFFLRSDGPHLDTGAIVAALEYAAGVRAEVIGKPAPQFFAGVAERLGVAPRDVLVVGDDPATDLAGARAAGARCALVRTGKARALDASSLSPRPDHVVDSIGDLPDLLGCA